MRVHRGLFSALMPFVVETGQTVSATPDAAGVNGQTLSVFAAASLRDVFGSLGAAFEREHPGARVQFNFAGSQELRTQIENGAPADVFVSADNKHMDAARKAGVVDAPKPFATNT